MTKTVHELIKLGKSKFFYKMFLIKLIKVWIYNMFLLRRGFYFHSLYILMYANWYLLKNPVH